MGSDVEVASCSKDKEKKCFRWSALTDYISAYISQMTFMRLDFKTDKPRMNAKLRVMMAEQELKSN